MSVQKMCQKDGITTEKSSKIISQKYVFKVRLSYDLNL